MGKDDWQFYGGTIERTNDSSHELKPPLSFAWQYDASAGFSPYSAAVVDNLLFVGNLQGEVHVVDIKTGNGRGVYDFGSAVYGTPVVDGDMMYVALGHDEESLVAYNLVLGKVVWKSKLGDIETSPLLLDNHLYITTLDGKLVSIEKEHGNTSWEYEVPSHETPPAIHSSPASDGNVIIFGCDDGSLYAVSKSDGQLKWQQKTHGSILASPSIRDSVVYVGSLDSIFYAAHVASGKIIWKTKLDGKIYASQAVDEKNVYVGSPSGTVFCLNRSNGAVLWEFKANSSVSAPPQISGNMLYVGSLDKNLYALDAKSGEQVWKFSVEGRIKSMPIIYREYLILLEDNRTVIALKQAK